MATRRIVPNHGEGMTELESMYGSLGESPLPQGNPPAQVPESPAFQMPPLETRSGPAPSYASGQQGVQPVTPPPGLPGPIYPGTWNGHSWHVGPSVHYTGKPDQFSGGQSPMSMYGGFGNPEGVTGGDFWKMFKFGVVDNAMLVAMAVLGANYDEQITKAMGVGPGWGPVFGAGVGNALSDGAAALTDRKGGFGEAMKAVAGVTAGCLLPVIPVYVVAKLMKKSPKDKMGTNILVGTSALLFIWAFTSKK
jgi:hypothetical protein